jgi:hypothetical protein
MRALHMRADPRPIIIDSWGDRLVPEAQMTTSPPVLRIAVSNNQLPDLRRT